MRRAHRDQDAERDVNPSNRRVVELKSQAVRAFLFFLFDALRVVDDFKFDGCGVGGRDR